MLPWSANECLVLHLQLTFGCVCTRWHLSNRENSHNVCAVTLTSALIALVIASVESLAVLASTMHWKGAFWTLMIDAPFEVLGYLIIGAYLHIGGAPCLLNICAIAAMQAFECVHSQLAHVQFVGLFVIGLAVSVVVMRCNRATAPSDRPVMAEPRAEY
jgi:hypothetical protein